MGERSEVGVLEGTTIKMPFTIRGNFNVVERRRPKYTTFFLLRILASLVLGWSRDGPEVGTNLVRAFGDDVAMIDFCYFAP